MDLFGANTADPIDNDKSLWADLVDHIGDLLDLAQHTGRGIHMRDGDQLVFLVLQRLFYLWKLGPVSNGRFQLCSLDTVCLEAVRERVGEVSSV